MQHWPCDRAVKRANKERKRARVEAESAQRAAELFDRITRLLRLGKAKKAHAPARSDEPELSAFPAEGAVDTTSLPDKADRAIHTAEFEMIQKLCGQSFTLDACCNLIGSNSLCEQFCNESNSFLEHSVVGNHIWLNAPFSELYEFIDHYVTQKETSPRDTSACILVPRWKDKGLVHPALAHMRLIKCFPKGYHLFNAPSTENANKRKRLAGVPWPLDVYYHPPTPVNTSKFAMQFKGLLWGTPVRILIDSGAKYNYLNPKVLQMLGIAKDSSVHTEVT